MNERGGRVGGDDGACDANELKQTSEKGRKGENTMGIEAKSERKRGKSLLLYAAVGCVRVFIVPL